MSYSIEKSLQGDLTSLSSQYTPNVDQNLSVCVCSLTGCSCQPATGQPSGLTRYDQGTCLSQCPRLGSWAQVVPGTCVRGLGSSSNVTFNLAGVVTGPNFNGMLSGPVNTSVKSCDKFLCES